MKGKRILPLIFAMCLTITACGQTALGIGASASPPGGAGQGSPEEQSGGEESRPAGAAMSCRIVDGAENGDLLLAELDGTKSGVYMLTVGDLPVTVDGKSASAADLTDGMTVEVEYSGDVLETYPAQFANVSSLQAQTQPGGGYTDLCGLWLKVLDDLWKVDAALNGMEDGSTVPYVGVDLSGVPGDLSAAEKAAVAWRFGRLHGATPLSGTFDELAEQGYIDRAGLFWKDGVFFSITENHSHDNERYSLPVLSFDAEKWRGGDGAYFFYDCKCAWPENGVWSVYTMGSEAVS